MGAILTSILGFVYEDLGFYYGMIFFYAFMLITLLVMQSGRPRAETTRKILLFTGLGLVLSGLIIAWYVLALHQTIFAAFGTVIYAYEGLCWIFLLFSWLRQDRPARTGRGSGQKGQGPDTRSRLPGNGLTIARVDSRMTRRGDGLTAPGDQGGGNWRTVWQVLRPAGRTEAGLFGLSMVFSLVYLLFLILGYPKYLYFFDKHGVILNIYFHLDNWRGITSIFTDRYPFPIHPFYRFSLFPLSLPGIFNQERVMADLYYGYLLCVVQAIINSLSAVLLYRILRQLQIRRLVAIWGTIVYLVSFATVFTAISPETHCLTVFYTLLGIWLYQRRSKYSLVAAMAAFGMNPITSVVLLPLLFGQMLERRRTTLRQWLHLYRLHLLASAAVLGLALLIISDKFISYVQTCSVGLASAGQNLRDWPSFFLIPWFFGPAYEQIHPYLVQTGRMVAWQGVMLACLLLAAIWGLIRGWHQPVIAACGLLLTVIFVLHGLNGYGLYCGTIYTTIYNWLAIILLAYGVNSLPVAGSRPASLTGQSGRISRLGWRALAAGLLLTLLLNNLAWTWQFGQDLAGQDYVSTDFTDFTPVPHELTMGDYQVYIQANGPLLNHLTGEVLVDHVTTYVYNDAQNIVTGVLDNGSGFKLYADNGQVLFYNRLQTRVLLGSGQ